MEPLVSIITPSYNQAKFVRKTIESVLSQDYENIEYIVIDGGSTDGTLDILKEYENKLVYISEKDDGQSDAINKGFRMAQGEIVAWLNSDDTYEPHCISRAVNEFKANQNLGLVYGDGYIIDEDDNRVKIFEYTQEFDLWKLVNFWDYIMQPAAFFRKSYLKEVGYLDVNLHYCMDWDLWIKLATISDIKYVHEIFACSREYGETKTSTGGDIRLKEIIGLLQKYSGKENPPGVLSYKASTRYTRFAKGIVTRKIWGKYLFCVHKKIQKNLPARYEDGWIGKRFEMVIPSRWNKVYFQMDTSDCLNLPLKVDVYINGIKISAKEYKQPMIDIIQIELPKDKCVLHTIALDCNKTFKTRGDNRKLAIKLLGFGKM